MTQLDRLDDEAILYLRAFRTVADATPQGNYDHRSAIWRYYLESCPHGRSSALAWVHLVLSVITGDLERLRVRYKAWG